MLTVAEIVAEAGLPEGAVSILPMTRELGDRMVSDERFKLLTFTGSPAVGWKMKERAGKKRVVLELGGNAGVIVDRSADLDWAVRRILVGAFSYAGQVCISVQRMFVHEAIWDDFMGRFVEGAAEAAGRRSARPADRRRPDGGRGRDRANAGLGGRGPIAGRSSRSLGGTADGSYFPPTILIDVPASAQVCRRRGLRAARGGLPVRRFRRRRPRGERQPSSACRRASSRTTWRTPGRAFEELEVGGVIVNDVPTYRIDHMPYGGVKDSGQGREGIRYAIEDMTEIRIMVLASPS